MKQKHFLLLFLALLMSLGARAQSTITLDDFKNGQKWPVPIQVATATNGTAKVVGINGATYDVKYNNACVQSTGNRVIVYNPESYIELPTVPGYKISHIEGAFYSDDAVKGRKIVLKEVLIDGTIKDVKTFNYDDGLEFGKLQLGDISPKSGAKYRIYGGQSGYIAMTSIVVTYSESYLQAHGVSFDKTKYVCELTPGQNPATATLSGLPVLENINHLDNLTYDSTNKNVATVDENGNVTPVGIGRTVIIVTRPEDDKYNEVHESYTLIIDDPTKGSSLNIYNKNINGGTSLKGNTINDDCENVSFSLSNLSGGDVPVYIAKGTDRFYGLKMFVGNTIDIKNLKDGYYIDRVVLTIDPKLSDYAPTEATVSTGKFNPATMEWSFDGINSTEGRLTLTKGSGTNTAIYVQDITVYLRKPVFTIAAKSGAPTVKVGETVDMKDWFVLNNLIAAADKDAITLDYAVTAGDAEAVSHDGSVFTGVKAGEKVTITASYTSAEGSKYVKANTASIELQVLDKDPYTVVVATPNKEIALYGNNGFNTYDAKTGIKFNKLDGTTSVGGTYSVTLPNEDVVKVKNGTVLEAVAEGTVEVTVTYTPAEAEADAYAVTNAKFNLTVKDARKDLDAKFAKKTYAWHTTSADAFVSPELTLPANSGLTAASFGWSSDNEALATVDENGAVTIKPGMTGSANIKAVLPKAMETNYSYKPFSASYKLVVVNPTETALEIAPVLPDYAGKNLTAAGDESGLISFSFATSDVSSANALRIYNNGSVAISIDSQKYPYYFIESVEFVPASNNNMEGATPDKGTLTGNTWSFNGVNTTSAILKNESGTTKNISNIKVYLRLAKVNITASDVDVESKGQTLTISDFITLKAQDGSELSDEDKAAIISALEYGVIADTEVVAYAEEKGKVVVKGIGQTVVPVSFPGIANKYEASSVDVTVNVVAKAKYTITVNPTEVKFNYNLDPVALPAVTVTRNGEATEIVPDFSLAEGENRIKIENGQILKGEGEIADGDVVEVTVSVAGNDDVDGDTKTFRVILSDDRLAPAFKFAAESKDFDTTAGLNFVAPALTISNVADVAAARAAITWSSDNENVVTVDNTGAVTIAKDLKGKYAVTIKAEIAEKNLTYKPVAASYVINVIGTPMTVAEYTADETAQFYVKGRILSFTDNTITIVDANTTEPSMTINTALADAKEGNTVIVEGAKDGDMLTAKSVKMLPNAKIQTSYRTIEAGKTVSVVNLPTGVTIKNIAVNPDEDVTIKGNVITFNAEGKYTLTVTTAETANYSETTQDFEVVVYTTPEYLADGQKVITKVDDNKLQLIVKENETILYTFNGENSEFTEAVEGVINFAGKTSGYVWVKTRITNGEESTETVVTRLMYDFTDAKANVAVGLVVSPADAMYNSENIYVRVYSDEFKYEWTQMERSKMVSHDKKLYVAEIPVPTLEETSLKGYVGNINSDIIPLDENTYTNATKASLETSGLTIIFSDKAGNELEFNKAPLKAEKDGLDNQVVIFSDDNVYSDMHVIDPISLKSVGTLENETGFGYWEDKLVNTTKWRGNWDDSKNGFYLTTAVDEEGKAVGTIFGASTVAPAEAPRRVMTKAAATSQTLAKGTPGVDIQPLTTDLKGAYITVDKDGNGTAAYSDDITTSIADIAADADADVMWYNLNGVRIATPTESGVYVRVKGGKAQKVIVRE